MPGLSATRIADFVVATEDATKKNRYQSIAEDHQHHEFVGRFWTKDGHRQVSHRAQVQGTGIKWFYKTRNSGTAEKTGLYAPTTGTNIDHLQAAQIEMAMGRSHWQYDDREASFQGTGVEKLLDFIKVREDSAAVDYATFMESVMWVGGSLSTALPPDFIGVVDWIQKGSATAFAFGGGNPSGWASGLGGLSRTTYENLRNATARFTTMNDGDLFPTWEEMWRKTKFVPPISYAQLVDGMPDCVYYTNNANIKEYKTYLTLANDNMLVDAGRYRGSNTFMKNPVVWIPYLDSDTQRPIYSINWASWDYVFLPGYEFKRRRPMEVGAQQEHVWRVSNNWIGQFICYDPRSNGVIHWVAA